jgi:hypothetical protein
LVILIRLGFAAAMKRLSKTFLGRVKVQPWDWSCVPCRAMVAVDAFSQLTFFSSVRQCVSECDLSPPDC